MKQYKIVYGDTITKRDLQKIDRSTLLSIKQKIEDKLTVQPDVFGKPLRRSLKGYRRMRIGVYRVICKIEKKYVRVVYIGKKPTVYDDFLRRVRSSD